jgi:hypothetical protein
MVRGYSRCSLADDGLWSVTLRADMRRVVVEMPKYLETEEVTVTSGCCGRVRGW